MHDHLELALGIRVEGGDVDDVVEACTCGREHGLEEPEGESDLLGEVGLGRAVLAAADLRTQLTISSSPTRTGVSLMHLRT